jgi:hypothetical protein
MLGAPEASARDFYVGRGVPSGAAEFALLQAIAQQHADALAEAMSPAKPSVVRTELCTW